MPSSQWLCVSLSLLAGVAGAFANYFYKRSASNFGNIPIYKNVSLFAGLFLFCVVLFLFIVAYRMGGRLNVIYPAYASTYIWMLFISVRFENEPWSWLQIFGTLFIIVGVSLIGIGAKTTP